MVTQVCGDSGIWCWDSSEDTELGDLPYLAETEVEILPASIFDNVVKSALLLCANLQCADYISLHCKVSFYKWSLLKVILTWEISLYLLGAMFIDSEKCTGTVIVSVPFVSLQMCGGFWGCFLLFVCFCLVPLAFGITDNQCKSLHNGKMSNNKYYLLHIYFLFFP